MADTCNEYSVSNKQSKRHVQPVNKGASESSFHGSTAIASNQGLVRMNSRTSNFSINVTVNNGGTETETAEAVKQDTKTPWLLELGIQEQCTSATGETIHDETEASVPSSKVSQKKVRRSGATKCHFCVEELIFDVDLTKVSQKRRIIKQIINKVVSVGHCHPEKACELQKFLEVQYTYKENEDSDDIKMDLGVIKSPMIRAITQENIEQIIDYTASSPEKSRTISDFLLDKLYNHWGY